VLVAVLISQRLRSLTCLAFAASLHFVAASAFPMTIPPCIWVPVTLLKQMRVEEVNEVQLQTAACSSTGSTFMRSNWSGLTDAASVLFVRVQLLRWLNGCFVGKQESGVRRQCCDAVIKITFKHHTRSL
jgi:hypothetical protein